MPSAATVQFRIVRSLSVLGIVQGLAGMLCLSGVIEVADPEVKAVLPLIGFILAIDSLVLAGISWFMGQRLMKRFEANTTDPSDLHDMRKQLAFVRFAIIVGVAAMAFLIHALVAGDVFSHNYYEQVG